MSATTPNTAAAVPDPQPRNPVPDPIAAAVQEIPTPTASAVSRPPPEAPAATEPSTPPARAASTSSATRITTKRPPSHRASPPATGEPEAADPVPAKPVTLTVRKHPQLRRPTTNIRPVDNELYGSVANGNHGGLGAAPNARRTFPLSTSSSGTHQQQHQPAAAAEDTTKHADPTADAAAGPEAGPAEGKTGLTMTVAPARPASAVPPRQPIVVIGRPSTAGQRRGRPAAAHPAPSVKTASVGSAGRPAVPSTVASLNVTSTEAPASMPARRRNGPTVGVQRNRVAIGTSSQHGAARSAAPSAVAGAESQTDAEVRPSPDVAAPGADLPTMSDLTRPSDAYKVGLRPTRQQRLITRNANHPRKIVNCHATKYPLIRRIAREMDFDIQETEDEFNACQFNLCWSDTVLPLTKLVRLGNWQRSNHFPSMYLLCRKGHLGTTLGRLRRKLPTHFAFYPHTWSMRSEKVNFQRYHSALKQKKLVRYFIMKPNSGCQGKGIVVTRDPLGAMEDVDNYIVQEYVHRPLLLEGKKFDLRIYILLTSIREPSIFMFNDGLVRICTEAYEPPNEQNATNNRKHLTNYAVNKHSTDYVFNTDVEHGDVGNKRNFRFLNRWLESEGHSAAKFWDEVGFLIVKTILTAQPQIAQVYNSCFPRYNEGYTCFEMLGFDVLIDSKMKPWLMEVNHTPSLVTDTPLDMDIKSKLIREIWDIVDCQPTDQQRDRLREHNEFTKRNMPPWATNHPIYSSPLSQSGRSNDFSAAAENAEHADSGSRSSRVMSPTTAAMSEAEAFRQMVEQRRRREDSKLKNFARIYPSKNENYSVVYETVRNLAQTEWSIPESTAGFTINGHQYDHSHTPTFATLSGTPLTPAQMQQQDRIRKDLRDIATGNFSATTGTGRNAVPVGRNAANRNASKTHSPTPPAATPSTAASVSTTSATPAESNTPSPSAPAATARDTPTITVAATPAETPAAAPVTTTAPISMPPPPANVSTSPKSEEYRKIEEELKRARRRQSDASANGSAPAPSPNKETEKEAAKPAPLAPVPEHTTAAAATAISKGTPTQSPTVAATASSAVEEATASANNGNSGSSATPAEDKEASQSQRSSKGTKSPKAAPTTHITLIEPTPEELARLDRLQQDLDEDEAADPEPPSEVSYDLHE